MLQPLDLAVAEVRPLVAAGLPAAALHLHEQPVVRGVVDSVHHDAVEPVGQRAELRRRERHAERHDARGVELAPLRVRDGVEHG